jgi:hypothetical protein
MIYSWPEHIKMTAGVNVGKMYHRHDTFPYEIYGTTILTGDYIGQDGIITQLYLYQHQDEWEQV